MALNHHAYLISSGNSDLAKKEVEKLLNSLAISHNSHLNPDLINLQPTKRTETIGINEIKELIEKLSLKPYQSSVNVAIIWQAEKLTIEAQNALLKTLEEPSSSSVIILVTTNYQQLLPTIISRCQVRFLTNQDIKENLEFEQVLKLINSSLPEKFTIAEENANRAADFLKTQTFIWRKLLLIKLKTEKGNNPELNLIAQKLTLKEIAQFLKEIQSSVEMIEANINPRFALEILLLKAPHKDKML